MTEYIARNTIRQLAANIRDGILEPLDLVEESLEKINMYDGLNAFIDVHAESSRTAAKAQRMLLDSGYDMGPLQGIPIAVKDNIDTTDGCTTYGSSIFAKHRPLKEATVVDRLRHAGAIIIGKTNLHEFAWGGTTDNPHYGTARNPWNTGRIPAGSSGGSGIAVATRSVCCALGTDTGGSIRLPSAMDGVCGIRPTLGDLPTDGIFPVAWSMDTVGPLCSNAEDTELVFQIMAGKPLVPANLPAFSRLRIGIISGYSLEGLQADVKAAFERVLLTLESRGAQIIEVNLPGVEEVVDAQLVVDAVEPSAVHYTLIQTDASMYGSDVLARLQAGCDLTGVEYVQAQRFRLRFRQEIERLFDSIDVLLTPTLPFTAPPVGAREVSIDENTTVSALSGNMKYTALASMSGLPAMSIPIGFDDSGLPVGMQIITPAHREDCAFGFAKAYQLMCNHHRQVPQMVSNEMI
ncbi:MAG: amidase [Bifidobacterium animalis]|nr:amidase [Bifidobacterium animalis]MDY5040938.1 amidase [Bifidobacterium animalis]